MTTTTITRTITTKEIRHAERITTREALYQIRENIVDGTKKIASQWILPAIITGTAAAAGAFYAGSSIKKLPQITVIASVGFVGIKAIYTIYQK